MNNLQASFESDLQIANSDTQQAPRFQRVKVSILGRYMLADRREFPCQVIEMSPGDAFVIAPASGSVGEKVIAYLDEVGRIEGPIIQNVDGGFILQFSATPNRREKIAAQLTWLANKDILDLPEERDHERIVPDNRHSAIILNDGRKYNCKIVDISISGAAIEIDVRPEMGTQITLGRMSAKVIRHFENGIGVQFNTPQEMLSVIQQNIRLA